ncbi:MAG: hypothetical protein JWN48_86 [Myxococcaceae bacterium]|nr:hypothetical protein [Myxococcaceae bacterium]
MSWAARRYVNLAVLALSASLSACGYVGLDLVDASSVLVEGGTSDAEVEPAHDAAVFSEDAAADAGFDASAGDASIGDASVGDGGVGDGGSPGVCNVSGTYAIKLTLELDWPSGVVVESGSGSSVIWAVWVADGTGDTLSGTMLPCGVTLPDFELNPVAGNELYRLEIADSLYDHVPSYLSPTPLSVSAPGGFREGAAFSAPLFGLQVGAGLNNPALDPWPTVGTLAAIDVDADGKPGVTATYSSETGYAFPHVALTQRADRAYTAARFALSASGTMTRCSDFAGSARFTNFDTHVVGCRLAGGAADCSATQRDTLDNGRPVFHAVSSALRAIKIAPGATCAQVRAALP